MIKDEGNFGTFDTLDYGELLSVLKSNRYSKIERHLINHMYVPQRRIRDFIPILIMLGVTRTVLETIDFNERETR